MATDPVLWQLVQGQLRSHQLPRTLHVWDLEQPLGCLRTKSLGVPAEQQVEWGGCLVLQEARLHIPHPVRGWANGVEPACVPEEHDVYVGFAHIHLPDHHGVPYPGFSAPDFYGTLVDGDHLALVCNGAEVFALVRAVDTTQPRRIPTMAELDAWEQRYADLIQQARQAMAADPTASQHGSAALHQALRQANIELCQRLGFVLYAGHWGQPLVQVFRPWTQGRIPS